MMCVAYLYADQRNTQRLLGAALKEALSTKLADGHLLSSQSRLKRAVGVCHMDRTDGTWWAGTEEENSRALVIQQKSYSSL